MGIIQSLKCRYHFIAGKFWCFMIENSMNVLRRDMYLRNAKKHLVWILKYANELEAILNQKETEQN